MHKDNLFIEKQYSTIEELKIVRESNKNEVRVYCVQYPDQFNFQIRTHKATTRNGKPKNMIATVRMDIQEMENILAYMKAEKDKD